MKQQCAKKLIYLFNAFQFGLRNIRVMKRKIIVILLSVCVLIVKMSFNLGLHTLRKGFRFG